MVKEAKKEELDTLIEKAVKDKDSKYKLLVSIVNRGFSEHVIEQSRTTGATGATVLSGTGSAGVGETFLGMNITPEKEVVMIVIKEELAAATMRVISEKTGVTSAAGGICFCLPVSHIAKTGHTNKVNTAL